MNFTHEKLQLVDNPDIRQVNESSRRYYETQYGKFTSITTVLGAMSDKTGLYEWRNRVGNEEANRESRIAAGIGTATHKLIEDYLYNLPLQKSKNPIAQMSFEAIKPVLDQRFGKVYAIEQKLFSKELRVAGTVDCIAEFDGKLSIIDFKTSKRLKKLEYIENYLMQETAYSLMIQDMSHGKHVIDQLVTLIAIRESKIPQIFIESREDWMKKTIRTINSYHKEYQ